MSANLLDDLIERLNEGDLAAAEKAFLAYEPYLRIAIRRQLSGPLRAKLDSRDVIQSVWADVLHRFREAGWRFSDRAHLRAFLMKVARNRLIDRRREHHRAIERERPLDELQLHEQPRAEQPRPSEVAQGEELWQRMLASCPPAHREILRLKREGLPLGEIAARTGFHEGSIRRILYNLAARLAVSRKGAGGPPSTEPDEN